MKGIDKNKRTVVAYYNTAAIRSYKLFEKKHETAYKQQYYV